MNYRRGISCPSCAWYTGVTSHNLAIITRTLGNISKECFLGIFPPELVLGHFFKTQPNPTQNFWTQPNPTQPNPQKSSPDPTQPIIDTWYGILGYTENFIQV